MSDIIPIDVKEEEKKYRKLLYKTFEEDILSHDENQRMQQDACLVIEGLRSGQKVANKNNKTNGKYTYKQVYCATVYSKQTILQAYKGKSFNNERAKIAYAAAIIRSNLNTVVDNLKEKEQAEKKIQSLDTNNLEHATAEYKAKTAAVLDDTLEGLW